MKLYHVFCMSDMAESDTFLPTRAAAMRLVREWGGKGRGRREEGDLVWNTQDDTVILSVVEVKPTRESISWALTNLPIR